MLAVLEVSAADDHGLSVPGERRHGAEWQVAVVAAKTGRVRRGAGLSWNR